MTDATATAEELVESLRKTPRMTVKEAMQHQWTGPVALADAIDGCGADQLTADTAPWLYRQGVPVRSLEKLFGVPYAQAYSLAKGAEPPVAISPAKPTKKKSVMVDCAKVMAMRKAGKKMKEIAKELEVGESTIYAAMKANKEVLETPDPVPETPPAPKITAQPAPEAEEPPILETPTPVVETIKVVTYRPSVPVVLLEQHRKTMEEILVTLECDARIAIDDRDYSIISEVVNQMKAVQVSIDLMTAEIRRCEP